MSEQDPTASYRKYPKGPNFNLVVALSAVFIVVAAIAIVLFLHMDAKKVDPHSSNPRPNARYQPLLSQPTIAEPPNPLG